LPYFLFDAMMFLITWLLHTLFATSGLGGGIILVPTYVSLGIALPIAVTSGLVMNIISLSLVTGHNYRHRIVRWNLGTVFLVPAIAMTPLGEMATSIIPRSYVLVIFIALLVYAFYHVILKRSEKHREKIVGKITIILAVPIGLIAGFLSGLSGIGGGLIILPALTFMEDDYRKIAGTTGYVALFISISSFIFHIGYVPDIPIFLWTIVISGSALGGVSASYFLHILGSRKISIFTSAVILILIGILIHSLI